MDGYDIRADVWSLGISLVQLATGKLPYSNQKFLTEFELLTHIVHAPPPLPDQENFSPQFYDFLSKWWVGLGTSLVHKIADNVESYQVRPAITLCICVPASCQVPDTSRYSISDTLILPAVISHTHSRYPIPNPFPMPNTKFISYAKYRFVADILH